MDLAMSSVERHIIAITTTILTITATTNTTTTTIITTTKTNSMIKTYCNHICTTHPDWKLC